MLTAALPYLSTNKMLVHASCCTSGLQYYPVEVEGGLLSMGDCHGSMGDGETSCTGIEVSLDGKFK